MADGQDEQPHTCHICLRRGRGMALLFGHWMCRDRVSCYQKWKGNI